MTTYDLELFRSLNLEYRDKPLVPRPRSTSNRSLLDQARKRARWIDGLIGVRGRDVLEIGAGRGHLASVLADEYGSTATGVDIVEYETWPELRQTPNLRLEVCDVTARPMPDLGRFDRVVSLAVLEHVERPYEALEAVHQLLRPGGVAYISANLYRGPKASHRYREVNFPFPHLLFDDSVFAEFYAPTKKAHTGAAWVNRLTAAQYREKVRSLGFVIEKEWADTTPLDRGFYERFEDVLGRYPIEDLETDFIHLVLSKDPTRWSRWRAGARSGRARAGRIAGRLKGRLGRITAARRHTS